MRITESLATFIRAHRDLVTSYTLTPTLNTIKRKTRLEGKSSAAPASWQVVSEFTVALAATIFSK